MQTKLSNPK
jgi:dynein heavy chain